MHYTIASLEDVHNDMTLDLVSSGNKKLVQLYNKETKQLTTKEFTSLSEAYKVFEKISKHICFGEYSESDRRAMLA